MKIHILYHFQEGPWGGGNQFLKALKQEFIHQGNYARNPEKADVILFNSHHELDSVFKIKKQFPKKILIHRVDGPVLLIRGQDKAIDSLIFDFNNLFADGTIFQSNWSRKQCYLQGMKKKKFETTIYNAPDIKIFNRKGRRRSVKGKIKLIATSWSDNWRKGFKVYQWLDRHLDFSKYEMIFVGNSPYQFKNIKWIKPIASRKIATLLKQSDIYLTASQKDPCSNSLIEALSCGLPAVVLADGGHPELARKGGETFKKLSELLLKIEKIAQNYPQYQSQIPNYSIHGTALSYYQFIKNIYQKVKNQQYQPVKVNYQNQINFYKIKLRVFKTKIDNKLNNLKNNK